MGPAGPWAQARPNPPERPQPCGGWPGLLRLNVASTGPALTSGDKGSGRGRGLGWQAAPWLRSGGWCDFLSQARKCIPDVWGQNELSRMTGVLPSGTPLLASRRMGWGTVTPMQSYEASLQSPEPSIQTQRLGGA